MNNNVKLILILSLFLVSFHITAQKFKWQAPINDISKTDYYKINISPDIISASENDGDDIRIFDDSGNEIPFFIEKEPSINKKEFFVEYKIITNESLQKWPYYSRIVIHNPNNNEISNFQLVIRNADVSKLLKLSGSDNRKSWYVIKDKYRFRSIYNDESTSVIKILSFPNSNYQYFEILIDDWRDNPIQIQKAGYFDMTVEEGKYAEIEKPEIKQEELKDEKSSFIKVIYASNQLLNKIHIVVEGPEFYYREAEILVKDSIIRKKKEIEYYYKTVHNFILSSNSLNNIYFTNFKNKQFYIKVKNYDNQPIKISSVRSWQLNNYMISKLESNVKYNIKTGNKEINAPVYDLEYFKNEIPKNLNVASIKRLENISKRDNAGPEGLQVNKIVIWIVIGAIALLLIYFTSKMMKDMKH